MYIYTHFNRSTRGKNATRRFVLRMLYVRVVYDNVRKKKKEVNVCFCVCKRTRARLHSCVRACMRVYEDKNRIDGKEWC